MTMTLGQVRDRLREVDSNGMSGDVCDELADAIDAHMAAVREVIAELRAIRTMAPVTWFGGLRLRVEIDKLEAAMPKDAK